jgi:hypothetical protein
VNRDEVEALRALLAPTGWPERAQAFARALRVSIAGREGRQGGSRGGLLLVGTPAEEPWHLAAHLDDESRLSGLPELAPTLVRWNAPPEAPPHLRIGLDRLAAARRGETLFVVSPEAAPVPLLERADDARRAGATILALNQGDPELDGLAHETLTVAPDATAPVTFTVAQHLVSVAAGDPAAARRGLRDRLAHWLDVVSGPSALASGADAPQTPRGELRSPTGGPGSGRPRRPA